MALVAINRDAAQELEVIGERPEDIIARFFRESPTGAQDCELVEGRA
jgi:hypothetical protein